MKEYLSRKGIEFEDLDVSEDDQAQRELIEIHRSNMTPTIVVEGEVIIGFDRERIDILLARP